MYVNLAMHGPNLQEEVAGFGSGRIWKWRDLEAWNWRDLEVAGFGSDRIVKWRNCAVRSEHDPNGPPYQIAPQRISFFHNFSGGHAPEPP